MPNLQKTVGAPATAFKNEPAAVSDESVSDKQIRIMPAPEHVDTLLWSLSTLEERQKLIQQEDTQDNTGTDDLNGGHIENASSHEGPLSPRLSSDDSQPGAEQHQPESSIDIKIEVSDNNVSATKGNELIEPGKVSIQLEIDINTAEIEPVHQLSAIESDSSKPTIPSIKSIWWAGNSGKFNLTINPLTNLWDWSLEGSYSDIFAVLSDGSVTRYLASLFSEEAEESKRKRPNDWGEGRENNGSLEIQWTSDKKFVQPGGFSVKSHSVKQLEGCFSKAQHSFGAGISTVISDTWQFNADGQFARIKTGMTNINLDINPDPEVSVYSSSDNAGKYKIDGHVIQLTYNNGSQALKTFGLLGGDGDKPTLLLGNNRYT